MKMGAGTVVCVIGDTVNQRNISTDSGPVEELLVFGMVQEGRVPILAWGVLTSHAFLRYDHRKGHQEGVSEVKKLLMSTCAVFALCGTAHADIMFTVPQGVSEGHMNMRDGPGTNHSLIGAIPAGAVVSASQCVPRDDGIRGANWCHIYYNGIRGWVSQAGLMPGGTPVPTYHYNVPQGTVIQQTPPNYPDGEPQYRGGPVSPDYFGNSYNGPMQGVPPPVPQPPPATRVSKMNLICTPGFDPQDRNPPTNIIVMLALEGLDVTNMEVAYDLRNGERVYRSRQYNATMKTDPSIYAGWTGDRVGRPGVTMAGGLYMDRSYQWHYREKLWENGRVTWDYTAPCTVDRS